MSVWWCELTTELSFAQSFVCLIHKSSGNSLTNRLSSSNPPSDNFFLRAFPPGSVSICCHFNSVGRRSHWTHKPNKRERELPAHVDAAATSGGRVDIVDTLTISFGKIPLLAADSCHFGSKQLIHQNQFATQLHVTSTHGYSQDKLWSQTGWLDGTLQMPRILHGVPTSCCIGHEWPWVWGLQGWWHGCQVRKWIWIRLCI